MHVLRANATKGRWPHQTWHGLEQARCWWAHDAPDLSSMVNLTVPNGLQWISWLDEVIDLVLLSRNSSGLEFLLESRAWHGAHRGIWLVDEAQITQLVVEVLWPACLGVAYQILYLQRRLVRSKLGCSKLSFPNHLGIHIFCIHLLVLLDHMWLYILVDFSSHFGPHMQIVVDLMLAQGLVDLGSLLI